MIIVVLLLLGNCLGKKVNPIVEIDGNGGENHYRCKEGYYITGDTNILMKDVYDSTTVKGKYDCTEYDRWKFRNQLNCKVSQELLPPSLILLDTIEYAGLGTEFKVGCLSDPLIRKDHTVLCKDEKLISKDFCSTEKIKHCPTTNMHPEIELRDKKYYHDKNDKIRSNCGRNINKFFDVICIGPHYEYYYNYKNISDVNAICITFCEGSPVIKGMTQESLDSCNRTIGESCNPKCADENQVTVGIKPRCGPNGWITDTLICVYEQESKEEQLWNSIPSGVYVTFLVIGSSLLVFTPTLILYIGCRK